jgi:hypothetical protein
MMAAWDEYLDAAGRLDAIRREAAEARAAEAIAAADLRHEIGALRQRIGLQRSRLLDIARRAGLPDPQLTDPQTATMAASPAVNQAPIGAQATAVHAARERLDTADALLSEVDGPILDAGPLATWSPARRNAVVYGALAVVVLVIQVVLFVAAPNGAAASVLAIGCGAVLPIIGYAVAWLAVGLLFRGNGRVERTPWLGAAICAAPILLLCTGLLTAAVLH